MTSAEVRREEEGLKVSRKLAEEMKQKREFYKTLKKISTSSKRKEQAKKKATAKVELSSDSDDSSSDSSSSSGTSHVQSGSSKEDKELQKTIDDSERRNKMLYGKFMGKQEEQNMNANKLESIALVPKLGEGEYADVPYEETFNRYEPTENHTVAFSTKSELSAEVIEKLRREEFEKKKRQMRYETRKNPDIFLKKILDLKIFSKKSTGLSPVFDKFEDYESYRKVWEPLFEYE